MIIYIVSIVCLIILIIVLLYFYLTKKKLPHVYEYNANITNVANNENNHMYQNGSTESNNVNIGKSINNGLTLLIISGVHGNERAGPFVFNKLVKSGYFKQNTLFKKIYLIPIANEFGYKHNIRYQNDIFNPDINRNFFQNTNDTIAKFIDSYVQKSDIILDFHEGYDFHLINNTSVGSTIKTNKQNIWVIKILNNLNKIINNPNKKFTLSTSICSIKNTLGCYTHNFYNDKIYILIETTGQNEIQPMNIRERQIMTILSTILHYSN